MRHFLFDAWRQPMLEGLGASVEPRVAAIARKAAKEATYHFERSRDLVVRLGDGSQESAQRMQRALDQLYPFLGELTLGDEVDIALTRRGIAPDLANVKARVDALLEDAFAEAGLRAPLSAPIRKGGKAGLHSEAFGLLLAEMQFLQRAYPGAQW
jgi:ring-1,2-phenylacetyl-CoA epoxidase subunit PaaC